MQSQRPSNRGRGRGRGNRSRNKRQPRGEGNVMQLVLDQLKLMAPSAPPELRDRPFPLIPRNQVCRIKRQFSAGVINASSTLPVFGAYSFTLSAFPDYNEFTALFDTYRFEAVRVTFIPNIPTGTTPLRFYTALDYDDATPLTSIGQIQEYDSVQTSNPNAGRSFSRVLSPKFAVAAYSGTFTSYSQSAAWCDAGSPGIQWFGLKYALEQGTTAQTVYAVEVEALFQFRYTR